jgi:putative drug exporter of the RND superfamily
MGVVLGVAVLLDTALVRLLILPVLLRLLGHWAWYLPGPLGRMLPQVRSATHDAQAHTPQLRPSRSRR